MLIDIELLIDLLSDEPREFKEPFLFEALVSYDFDYGWMAEFKMEDGEFETIDGHFNYPDQECCSFLSEKSKTKKWAVQQAIYYAQEHKPCKITAYPQKGDRVYRVLIN